MNAACARTHGQNRGQAFWEIKARRYPLPFDLQSMARTKRVLTLLQEWGVGFAGAAILDIGCGTGCFTLPLARNAAKVVGLDFSAAMLDRLHAEAARFRIRNVQTHCLSWQEAEPSELGFADAFDLAWTSMSAAVRNEADLAKMEQCSHGWCVFTGWGKMRDNPLLEEAFTMHGLAFAPPPGMAAMHAMVRQAGREPFLAYQEISWDWEGTMDEAMEDVAGHIEVAGATPDKQALRGLLDRKQWNGVVQHTTRTEEGVMAWQVG
jgi:SAM-dependent methyltransferase